MHIQFLWFGVILAGLFLATVMALFGLALKLLTRTTAGVRDSVLPSLISGFRGWAADRGPARSRFSSPGSPEALSLFEHLQLCDGPPVQRIHAQIH